LIYTNFEIKIEINFYFKAYLNYNKHIPKMTTSIERYLNSLSSDIDSLDINGKDIQYLPDLKRFKNLKTLFCDNNKLTSLPTLPKNLEELYCSNNQLSLLPNLSENLKILCCYNNQLTSLPTLPQNLEELYCFNNQLTSLPTLSENLEELDYGNNPIYEIVNNNCLIKIKKNIKILNKFRYLYYCLKFKKPLRKWLWEKVREPNIMKIYSPKYLVENLDEDDDLDTVLKNLEIISNRYVLNKR